MRRVVLCGLSSCALAALAVLSGPASADQYPERGARVWYSSSCCYVRIGHDVTSARYQHAGRGYRPTRVRYSRRYRTNHPWPSTGPHHSTHYPYRPGSPYANYVPSPDCRLVRLTDGAGGWIWARRAGCL